MSKYSACNLPDSSVSLWRGKTRLVLEIVFGESFWKYPLPCMVLLNILGDFAVERLCLTLYQLTGEVTFCNVISGEERLQLYHWNYIDK